MTCGVIWVRCFSKPLAFPKRKRVTAPSANIEPVVAFNSRNNGVRTKESSSFRKTHQGTFFLRVACGRRSDTPPDTGDKFLSTLFIVQYCHAAESNGSPHLVRPSRYAGRLSALGLLGGAPFFQPSLGVAGLPCWRRVTLDHCEPGNVSRWKILP